MYQKVISYALVFLSIQFRTAKFKKFTLKVVLTKVHGWLCLLKANSIHAVQSLWNARSAKELINYRDAVINTYWGGSK